MARKPKVRQTKYNYQKELKKILKNPKKRDHAGVVVFVNGDNLEYPPRIVDLNNTINNVDDVPVASKFFEETKMRISSLPAVYINKKDVMTSVGMHYTHLVKGSGEEKAPEAKVVDGYYIEGENNKKEFIKHKHKVTQEFQPSQTLPPAVLQSIIIEETKVGDIKKWLEKNKTILYLAFGIGACVLISAFLIYEIKTGELVEILSKLNSAISNINILVNNCAPAANVVTEVVALP